MMDRVRARVLRLLRVPPAPAAPAGEHSSTQIFRAAPAYYRYKLLAWGLGQISALIGLVVGLVLLTQAHRVVPDRWLFLVQLAEAAAWTTFLAQLPVSYALLRLDYELRWYLVSNRSLRIREGLLRLHEQTLTFANIQQLSIRQGPLQRLLGIADLEVRTAGGGGGGSGAHGKSGESGSSMHMGYLRGIDNAARIRDLVRERIRGLSDTGLGDPDDHSDTAPVTPDHGLLAAARELAAESGLLRRTLAPPG